MSSQQEIVRPENIFPPTLWKDTFVSMPHDNNIYEMYAQEMDELKEEVRHMLKAEGTKMSEKLRLIDNVERLGLSYHFEKEIDEQLKKIFELKDELEDSEDYDLFTAALQFRLFRQHGYDIHCSTFDKFKDTNDRLKETLKSDIAGLLSLYEATHLRMRGEKFLEEAFAFSKYHLKNVVAQLDAPLQAKVAHALEQSLQRGVPRVEVHSYISIYGREETKNESLLRLATLDFNSLQQLYKKELYDLTRWWNELDLKSKLPYARDRLVECYFWATTLHYEQHYSYIRSLLTKILVLLVLLDDTYDSYGTLDELEILTDALQRWDINEIDRFPADYMKIMYGFILDVYKELEEEAVKQGRLYVIGHAKESLKQLAIAYHKEAKWFIGNKIPSFPDFMANGIITSAHWVIITASFLGIDSTSEETYRWLMREPKISVACALINRFVNDIASYQRENRGGQVPTAVDCYVKQFGVSEEKAIEKFFEIAENAWTDINEEWLKIDSIPKNALVRIVNLARVIDVTYKHEKDGYTYPEIVLKQKIVDLFVDSVSI